MIFIFKIGSDGFKNELITILNCFLQFSIRSFFCNILMLGGQKMFENCLLESIYKANTLVSSGIL